MTRSKLEAEILAALAKAPVRPRRSRRAPTRARVAARSARAATGRDRNEAAGRFRDIGGEGDPWPEWLRGTADACGVYAIRNKASGKVVYVGSSKSRLYDTVTRHFQSWRRAKKWWSGAYGAGHDPGMTYERGRHEVSVRLTSCDARLKVEAQMIHRYKPEGNLVENPDGKGGDGLEKVPF